MKGACELKERVTIGQALVVVPIALALVALCQAAMSWVVWKLYLFVVVDGFHGPVLGFWHVFAGLTLIALLTPMKWKAG
jgi:hypothetical protein